MWGRDIIQGQRGWGGEEPVKGPVTGPRGADRATDPLVLAVREEEFRQRRGAGQRAGRGIFRSFNASSILHIQPPQPCEGGRSLSSRSASPSSAVEVVERRGHPVAPFASLAAVGTAMPKS